MNLSQSLRRGVWSLVRGLVRRVKRQVSSSRLVRGGGRAGAPRTTRRTGEAAKRERQGRVGGGGGGTWSADERTQRRVAEAQLGGEPSQVSAEKYARGENPGGTHQHRNVDHESGASPIHQRPELEEPQGREERVPGGERHMSSTRRGS